MTIGLFIFIGFVSTIVSLIITISYYDANFDGDYSEIFRDNSKYFSYITEEEYEQDYDNELNTRPTVKNKFYYGLFLLLTISFIAGTSYGAIYYKLNVDNIRSYEQMVESGSEDSCDYVITTKELYKLGDTSNISGTFFLGSGRFESEQIYTYYYKHRSGYEIGSLYAPGVLVLEDDSEIPRIEWYSYECTTENGIFKRKPSSEFGISNKFTDVIIYIPVGSVLEDYHLDAE